MLVKGFVWATIYANTISSTFLHTEYMLSMEECSKKMTMMHIIKKKELVNVQILFKAKGRNFEVLSTGYGCVPIQGTDI